MFVVRKIKKPLKHTGWCAFCCSGPAEFRWWGRVVFYFGGATAKKKHDFGRTTRSPKLAPLDSKIRKLPGGDQSSVKEAVDLQSRKDA